jgi:hypothetical protein
MVSIIKSERHMHNEAVQAATDYLNFPACGFFERPLYVKEYHLYPWETNPSMRAVWDFKTAIC